MIRSLLPLVTIALLGFAPDSNAAEVNKCIDADGKVSYSSQPCPQDAAAEKVKIRKGPSNVPAEAEPEPSDWEARIEAETDPERKKRLQILQQQCELAQTQLDKYEKAPYLLGKDDEGNERRLSSEEAEAEKQKLRDFMASNCQ